MGVLLPLKVTVEILSISNRAGYISLFKRLGSDKIYVFEGSLVNLQRFYKTPLAISTLKNGIIYTEMLEAKILSHVAKSGNLSFIRTAWGYECQVV